MLDDKMVEAATSAAILSLLTEENRSELIRKAISEHLFSKPEKSIYHAMKPVTRIQAAFNEAVDSAAREFFHDAIKENRDGVRDKLESVFADAAKKFCEDHGEGVAKRMAEAMSKAMQVEY